ncbi:hypothetical protein WA026_007690 [Henosepilachna vigintioctopunctata]|uniref:Uncharacterized protein n=1 Tax=Henosepilachna vigintioctopunctata TaxID=420089 RepID=A0AAW1U2V2_9CUCU
MLPRNPMGRDYDTSAPSQRITTKSKHTIQYPNLSSAKRPILHNAELPVPMPPNRSKSENSSPESVLSQHNKVSEDSDPSYEP